MFLLSKLDLRRKQFDLKRLTLIDQDNTQGEFELVFNRMRKNQY